MNQNTTNNNQPINTSQNVGQGVNTNMVQNNVEGVEQLKNSAGVNLEQAAQNQQVAQPTSQMQVQPENKNTNSGENKGPSGFAKVMTVLLFLSLFVFVYFLSDITEYINQRKIDKQTNELLNGKLICTANKDSDNLSIKTEASFVFENKGIISLNYKITTTGDKQKDKAELAKVYDKCKLLREEILSNQGVKVICSQDTGVVIERQEFDYKKVNANDIRASYSEAGGVYPEFKYGENINRVQNKMITSDFECEKIG